MTSCLAADPSGVTAGSVARSHHPVRSETRSSTSSQTIESTRAARCSSASILIRLASGSTAGQPGSRDPGQPHPSPNVQHGATSTAPSLTRGAGSPLMAGAAADYSASTNPHALSPRRHVRHTSCLRAPLTGRHATPRASAHRLPARTPYLAPPRTASVRLTRLTRPWAITPRPHDLTRHPYPLTPLNSPDRIAPRPTTSRDVHIRSRRSIRRIASTQRRRDARPPAPRRRRAVRISPRYAKRAAGRAEYDSNRRDQRRAGQPCRTPPCPTHPILPPSRVPAFGLSAKSSQKCFAYSRSKNSTIHSVTSVFSLSMRCCAARARGTSSGSPASCRTSASQSARKRAPLKLWTSW
jgi:hypothetical protein